MRWTRRNRLTLPSKLRGAFGDGVVVTRGLDGCLFAWPVEAWAAMAERLEAVDQFSVDGRRIRRHFFSGAAHGELGQAGTARDSGDAARDGRDHA